MRRLPAAIVNFADRLRGELGDGGGQQHVGAACLQGDTCESTVGSVVS